MKTFSKVLLAALIAAPAVSFAANADITAADNQAFVGIGHVATVGADQATYSAGVSYLGNSVVKGGFLAAEVSHSAGGEVGQLHNSIDNGRLTVGQAFDVGGVNVIPNVSAGRSTVNQGIADAAVKSVGAGVIAQYAPVKNVVVSARGDLNRNFSTVNTAFGGSATDKSNGSDVGVGVDYRVYKNVHVGANFTRTDYKLAGADLHDNRYGVSVGLGF